jgi:hypothetical protein
LLAKISAVLAKSSQAIASSSNARTGSLAASLQNRQTSDVARRESAESKIAPEGEGFQRWGAGLKLVTDNEHAGAKRDPRLDAKAQKEEDEDARRRAKARLQELEDRGDGEEDPDSEDQREALEKSFAFEQLIDLLRMSSNTLGKGFGANAYQASVRKQKKSAKFRKGTLVDQKIE